MIFCYKRAVLFVALCMPAMCFGLLDIAFGTTHKPDSDSSSSSSSSSSRDSYWSNPKYGYMSEKKNKFESSSKTPDYISKWQESNNKSEEKAVCKEGITSDELKQYLNKQEESKKYFEKQKQEQEKLQQQKDKLYKEQQDKIKESKPQKDKEHTWWGGKGNELAKKYMVKPMSAIVTGGVVLGAGAAIVKNAVPIQNTLGSGLAKTAEYTKNLEVVKQFNAMDPVSKTFTTGFIGSATGLGTNVGSFVGNVFKKAYNGAIGSIYNTAESGYTEFADRLEDSTTGISGVINKGIKKVGDATDYDIMPVPAVNVSKDGNSDGQFGCCIQ